MITLHNHHLLLTKQSQENLVYIWPHGYVSGQATNVSILRNGPQVTAILEHLALPSMKEKPIATRHWLKDISLTVLFGIDSGERRVVTEPQIM